MAEDEGDRAKASALYAKGGEHRKAARLFAELVRRGKRSRPRSRPSSALRQLRDDLSPAWLALVAALLAKAPEDRHSDAAERQAVGALDDGLPPDPTPSAASSLRDTQSLRGS